jgi:hypothetical protein
VQQTQTGWDSVATPLSITSSIAVSFDDSWPRGGSHCQRAPSAGSQAAAVTNLGNAVTNVDICYLRDRKTTVGDHHWKPYGIPPENESPRVVANA